MSEEEARTRRGAWLATDYGGCRRRRSLPGSRKPVAEAHTSHGRVTAAKEAGGRGGGGRVKRGDNFFCPEGENDQFAGGKRQAKG